MARLGPFASKFLRRNRIKRDQSRRPRFDVELLENRALLTSSTVGELYAPGQLLVKYRDNAQPSNQLAMLAGLRTALGTFSVTSQSVSPFDSSWQLLSFSDESIMTSVANALRNEPTVLYAEPNWFVSRADVPDDPMYVSGSQWGMYGDQTSPASVFGSQAGEAWAAGYTGSSTVYVGVIDEGIMIQHPDLASNIWFNPHDRLDGVDNDGNGFVDDINGWDFYYNDRTVYDGVVDDHGTHVAGIIGAKGGNGVGVAGVNWNVTLISAKFLGPQGGTIADAIKAIDYITNLKLRHGLNIVATNNSWIGGGYSQALFDAIGRAAKADILFVAAAGNGGADGKGYDIDLMPTYPASYNTTAIAGYNNVIAVAAINSNGARAGFSNFGATTVAIGAPGVGIMSTVPGAGNTFSYKNMNGTSMATPFVTGAAALYKSRYPTATAAQIRDAILNTAVATSSMAGKTITGGRLDISAMLAYPPPTTGGGSNFRRGSAFEDPIAPERSAMLPRETPNTLMLRVPLDQGEDQLTIPKPRRSSRAALAR